MDKTLLSGKVLELYKEITTIIFHGICGFYMLAHCNINKGGVYGKQT